MVVVLCSSSALAAADDIASARAHCDKGKHEFDLGRFVEAAREYELAYDAKDDPALLFNIGQAYRLAGNYPRAINAYRSFLRNVPNSSNADVLNARIREMQLMIEQQAGHQPSPPMTVAPMAAPATRDEPPTHWYRSAIGWSLVGVGAAAAIVGGVLIARGQSLYDDSRKATQIQPHYDLHSQADGFNVAGIALLGSCGAMLIGAATTFALEHRREHRRAVRIGVAPTPDGAFVFVGGAI